jgi:hypothetical protein
MSSHLHAIAERRATAQADIETSADARPAGHRRRDANMPASSSFAAALNSFDLLRVRALRTR